MLTQLLHEIKRPPHHTTPRTKLQQGGRTAVKSNKPEDDRHVSTVQDQEEEEEEEEGEEEAERARSPGRTTQKSYTPHNAT